MATTQYTGARYVPLFADPIEWSSDLAYEPLTIVTHEGNSYTSRQFVPKGVDISSDKFWALSGNYNAQIELYRQEVSALSIAVQKTAQEFDTVADMQANQSLKPGLYCHSLGFHKRNDGGSAYYAITDSGIADGCRVIGIPTNENPVLFATLIKLQTFVTPEMYGAYGDGVHNDTLPMNACFEDNEVIVMPFGKQYFIDYIDIIKKNTHIYGNNSELTFNSHRQGNIGDTVNIHKSELLSNRLAYKKDSNIQMGTFEVENLNINGNSGDFTNYSDYSHTYNMFMCIQLYNYESVVIKNCKFFNTIQDAVHLHNANNVAITNNTFVNIANGERVKTLKGSANALTVSGLLDSRAVISNNTFKYVYNECARIDDFTLVEFTNNFIRHCYQYCLELFFHNASEKRVMVISENNVNELRDSFINLDTAQSVACEVHFHIKDNLVKGIGSKSFSDEKVSLPLYSESFITAPLKNGDLVFNVCGNNVSIENYEATSNKLTINCRYNTLKAINNVFNVQKTLDYQFAAKSLMMDSNLVTLNNDSKSTGILIAEECKLLSNEFNTNTNALLYLYSNSDRKQIEISDNDLTLGNSAKILDTDKSKPYEIVIIVNNRVHEASLFSDSCTINNLVYTGNVLPSSFTIPSNATINNKIEQNLVKQ